MRDFLIDTNIWSFWFDRGREPQHSNVMKRVHELEQTCTGKQATFRVWISAITLGEIEYGYRAQTEKEQSLEVEFRRFIYDIGPTEFVVDKQVAREYGRIRGRLFEEYGPKDKKRKGLRPEELIDPATSLQLTIQENDLWIVAQAITRDLTLVTNDRKSLRPLLAVAGNELHIENWAAESIS